MIFVHCHTREQWAVDLLQYTDTLLRISGQWGSFGTMPHYWGAVGSGPPSALCYAAGEHWAVDSLEYTDTLLRSSG